jgi:hypothetical protein
MQNNVSNSANSAGKVRPGQPWKPYVKATRQQIDERRGYVARLLRAGKTKTQIHRAIREKFGIEWRQCDRYIAWLTKSDAPDT